jgi:hypothetical protein
MAEDKMNLDWQALERKIVVALENAPLVDVPAGFAARVAGSLPAQPTLRLTPARYGVRAALVCLVTLMLLMLVAAPRAMGSSALWLSIESIFCAQFALLAVWLVTRSYRSSSSF